MVGVKFLVFFNGYISIMCRVIQLMIYILKIIILEQYYFNISILQKGFIKVYMCMFKILVIEIGILYVYYYIVIK